MSTNYYALDEHCPHCSQILPEGSEMNNIHLGKASIGWAFLLQYNAGKYYKNWLEMKGWLIGKKIINEYDKPISLSDFILLVEGSKYYIDPERDLGGNQVLLIDGYRFYDCDFS